MSVRVLGLDIGGSTTRALLDEDGVTVAVATGTSASLTAAGNDAAGRVLAGVLAQLGLEPAVRATPLQAVCVGTAGSGDQKAVRWVRARLRHLVAQGVDAARGPDASILVVNDSRIVLAAEGLDSGIALVAGTGSTAIGVLGTREERAGGWGYLLGDAGSGYWIVREALRELCRRQDEHLPIGSLGDVLGGDARHLIADFHEEPAPSRWASLAPAVLDSGDPFATSVCESAARCLAGLVRDVAVRLSHPPPVPVVISGGLGAHHPRLSEATARTVAELVPSARVTIAAHAPVEGAVRLARDLASGRTVAAAN